MAYMSQENKASKAPKIAAICKQFGVKATLAVRHHSTLVLNISSGPIDFISNYNANVARRNFGHDVKGWVATTSRRESVSLRRDFHWLRFEVP